MSIILGVDPGSRITGFGFIKYDNGRVQHLDHGVINVSSIESFSERISIIGQEIKKLIQSAKPQIISIEKIFLGKNADSAFKLGHARGIIIYEAELAKLQIFEYSTRLVKKGVTGRGEATKEEVQSALNHLLKIKIGTKIDASDALALAYYQTLQMELQQRLQGLKDQRITKLSSRSYL